MSLIDENSSPDSSSASDTTAIPSPQLKELNLSAYSPKLWDNFYLQTLSLLDRLYHDCRLVHGDLSEYNLLLHSPSQTIYMIDFGQSVDTSHPNHRQFLQRDIHTINTFFQRLGVGVKSEGRILENIENGDRQFFHIESEV